MKPDDIFHLFEESLFEVDMSPSNLTRLAEKIPDALVGIEYEMQIPGIYSGDDDDRTGDEPAYDIDDICSFFDDNPRNDTRRLRDQLYEELYEYQSDQLQELWRNDGLKYFTTYCRENVTDEEVLEYLGKLADAEEEHKEDDVEASKNDWEEFIQKQWDDEDRLYDSAREEFEEEYRDEFYSERDFLRSIGISSMSDVTDSGNYNMSWPHSSGGAPALAEDFMEYMGLDSVAYLNEDEDNYYYYEDGSWEIADDKPYHLYIFESDSSLTYHGPELVGPTQSLEQTLIDSKKIRKWARTHGATTSTKTGLHMNVSIPGFSIKNLDYVKLALLLGDKYILQQFNRYGSYYAESALDIVKENAKDPEAARKLLSQLKTNMNEIASKIIHAGNTRKFTSINTKPNRVEFRSPGGNWLGQDFTKYENALRRFVVALDAACDPKKYKKEYYSKLHTILTGDKNVRYYDPGDPANRLAGPNGPGTGAVNPVPKKFLQINDFDGINHDEREKNFTDYVKQNRRTLRTYITDDKALDNFAKLMAGEMTTEEYIRELEKGRKERLRSTGVGIIYPEQVEEGDWVVEYDDGVKKDSFYIAKNEAVPNERAAWQAAKQFKPNWFKPNKLQYISVTPFEFEDDIKELNLYRADYNHKTQAVVAPNEADARKYIRIMDPDYFAAYPDTYINIYDEQETSKRKIKNFWDSQQRKIEVGREWLARPKIWRARERRGRGRGYYIAAIDRDEAINIANALENEDVMSTEEWELYVHDSYPSLDTYQAHERAQNDLIRSQEEEQRAQNDLIRSQEEERNSTVDLSKYHGYRVSSMNGFMYVVASNGGEAAEIANKMDPEKFPRVQDLTVQEASDSVVGPTLVKSMYFYQLRKIREREEDQSNDWRNNLRSHIANTAAQEPSTSEFFVSNIRSGETISVRARDEDHARQIATTYRPNWSGLASNDINVTRRRQSPPRVSQLQRFRVQNTDSGDVIYVTAYDLDGAITTARNSDSSWRNAAIYAVPEET